MGLFRYIVIQVAKESFFFDSMPLGPRSTLRSALSESLRQAGPGASRVHDGQVTDATISSQEGEFGDGESAATTSNASSFQQQNIIFGENFSVGSLCSNGSMGRRWSTHGHGHMMHRMSYKDATMLDGGTPQRAGALPDDIDDVRNMYDAMIPGDVLEPLAGSSGDIGMMEKEDGVFPETPPGPAIVFGVINAIAGIPALIAFASIVFQHEIYKPFLESFCRLFFLSSAFHQIVFNVYSTLPFAMGQVQDVGVVFLKAIASSIAGEIHNVKSAVSTSLVCMTLSTLIVGLFVLLVAKKRWAGFVNYIPLPVIAGYLSYVGFFCIQSGVSLAINRDLDSLVSWFGVFRIGAMVRLFPAVVSCVLMIMTMKRVSHPMALPGLLISLVLVFHIFLRMIGVSLEDAADGGWVSKQTETVAFWNLWKLYDSSVSIQAIWKQAAKVIGLTLLVVFGSSIDIIAISHDVPVRLDFNRELKTVAISNIATGVLGVGFTGSYIFSQTIFTLKSGIYNRLNGWVISVAELLCVISPWSILAAIPNYFLAALVMWFGYEICRDWLFFSYDKMTRIEYIALWVTFVSVMNLGLEGGIVVGMVVSTAFFARAYAKTQVENLKPLSGCHSNVVRQLEHQEALTELCKNHLVVVELKGFIFFGSSASIGTEITKLMEHHFENAVACKLFVIDFSQVTGVQSSGAITISNLARSMYRHGITAILTGIRQNSDIERLLVSNGLDLRRIPYPPVHHGGPGDIDPHDVFKQAVNLREGLACALPTLENAIRFAEDMLLFYSGLLQRPASSLEDVLKSHLENDLLQSLLGRNEPTESNGITMQTIERIADSIRACASINKYSFGDRIWLLGETAEEFIIVEEGIVSVTEFTAPESDAPKPARTFELGPGCLGGSTDFFLGRPHSTQAYCSSTTCRVLVVSRTGIQKMAQEAPHQVLTSLLLVVMRQNLQDLNAAGLKTSQAFD